MKKTLIVLNELEKAGFFRRYAIGGAIAAIFYIEAFETEDLDVLILLPPDKVASLAPLAAIYEEARARGYKEDGPFLIIEGIPVQFLVAYSRLVEEAVEQAVEVPYEDIATRIPTAEHLAAIMLATGRSKDRERFLQMRRELSLDSERMMRLMDAYGLGEKYQAWIQP